MGEKTLIDSQVRDTWELPKSRVRIGGRRWNRTLVPVLDELRADLGLPDSCRLRAELHSVLNTERGLSFGQLKGVDAGRVAVLRAAARERDDEIVLALADVHETWSCDEPYQRRSWYDDQDEYEDDDEPDTAAYDVGELLDGATNLAASIEPSGVPAQIGPSVVRDDEICAATPSGQFGHGNHECGGADRHR